MILTYQRTGSCFASRSHCFQGSGVATNQAKSNNISYIILVLLVCHCFSIHHCTIDYVWVNILKPLEAVKTNWNHHYWMSQIIPAQSMCLFWVPMRRARRNFRSVGFNFHTFTLANLHTFIISHFYTFTFQHLLTHYWMSQIIPAQSMCLF